MLSYKDWKNNKIKKEIKEEIVSQAPDLPTTTNGTDDISGEDFFGNMRYKPGSIRQKMIKKQKKNCNKI